MIKEKTRIERNEVKRILKGYFIALAGTSLRPNRPFSKQRVAVDDEKLTSCLFDFYGINPAEYHPPFSTPQELITYVAKHGRTQAETDEHYADEVRDHF